MSLSPTLTYQLRPKQVTIIGDAPADAVSGNDVKLMLPVYDNQSTLIIERLIKSVQRRVEDFIDIDTTPRTRQAWWQFPAQVIELPYGTHGDVTSVERYENKEWVAFEDYEVEGLTYKQLRLERIGLPLRVMYQSGTSVAEQVNQAILQEVAWQFKNRNDPNQSIAETRSGLSIATINILDGVMR